MTNPIAVLVEDDPQQAEFSRGVLEAAGYSVRAFNSIAPARDYFRMEDEELIDLFVLDRRLPVNAGDPATDEFGDELLKEVRSGYPDARLIVFTGFATISHVQASLQGSGQLPSQGGHPIDRVTVLEKHQSLEFRGQVQEFRRLLQSLEDIEIIAPGVSVLNELDKRVLRRLAFNYRAVSISAVPLGGGLTGASVWRCEISRSEGRIAAVVAKRVKSPGSPGGLPELLPRVNTTATVSTLSGLMAGAHLNVLQVAGESPHALMDVIAGRPDEAVELVQPVWDALRGVEAQRRTLTAAELCESLIAWESLSELLGGYGISIPAGSLSVSAKVGPRHGDLHPGNILVDNGHAVLIDFDSEVFAAGALDPITTLISTLVHPDSPIRGSAWPVVGDIEEAFATANFGQGHPCELWFRGVHAWVDECRTSEREYWALVLAYAGRQVRYQDVLDDPEVLDRVLAIARRAADALANS